MKNKTLHPLNPSVPVLAPGRFLNPAVVSQMLFLTSVKDIPGLATSFPPGPKLETGLPPLKGEKEEGEPPGSPVSTWNRELQRPETVGKFLRRYAFFFFLRGGFFRVV